MIEERRGTDDSVLASYVHGAYIDDVVTMRRAVPQGGIPADWFFHSDDQFSVSAVTNAPGALAERVAYGDFGAPVFLSPGGVGSVASAIGNPYAFTGRRWDAAERTYHYRFRTFSPGLGRFTTRDPIGIWGDALNLGNGYTYTGNDPWSWVDPWGLQFWGWPRDRGGKPWGHEDPALYDHSDMMEGMEDGWIGLSVGIIDSSLPGNQNYTDPCNEGQQFGYKVGRILMAVEYTLAQHAVLRGFFRTKFGSKMNYGYDVGMENDHVWRALSLRDKVLYEIGQMRMSDAAFNSGPQSMTAVQRGIWLLRNPRMWGELEPFGAFSIEFAEESGWTALDRYVIPKLEALIVGGLHLLFTSNNKSVATPAEVQVDVSATVAGSSGETVRQPCP